MRADVTDIWACKIPLGWSVGNAESERNSKKAATGEGKKSKLVDQAVPYAEVRF